MKREQGKKNIRSELFRLLESQKEIHEKQITLAEKEKKAIIAGNEDTLRQYKELEGILISKADAVFKVMKTFDREYTLSNPDTDPELESLKADIERLQERISQLNKENQKELQKQMKTLNEELTLLSKKTKKKPSPFKKIGNPSFIDLKA